MKSFSLFWRGLLMGLADLVPGISGGTMALITGIYTKFIDALGSIKVWPPKKALHSIDWKFFIPLGSGIALAILLLSRLISFLLNNHTSALFALFAGLIIASAIHLWRQVTHTSEEYGSLILGAIISYVIVGLTSNIQNHSLPLILISGVIAISAMILPGISGSFLLLLLNQYHYLLNVIHTFQILPIITFIAGAAIGILSFSKFLKYLLHHKKKTYLSYLTGFHAWCFTSTTSTN